MTTPPDDTTAPVTDLTVVARWAEANGGPGSQIQAAARRLLAVGKAMTGGAAPADERVADVWDRVDEAIDRDPLLLRAIVAEVLAERDHALAELSSLRDHRARWEVEHERAVTAEAQAKQLKRTIAAVPHAANAAALAGAWAQRDVALDRAEVAGVKLAEVTAEVERLRAELATAHEERDAARLVSEGRTMEQYDAEAAIERVRKALDAADWGGPERGEVVAEIRAALGGGE